MLALTAEQTNIVNKLRRCKDASKIVEYKERCTILTKHIAKCRREFKCAIGILERSEHMKENLKRVSAEAKLVDDQISRKKRIRDLNR